MVRERDYASFLSGQACPANLRDAFFALRAFTIELASVPEMVSNPTLGKMRYQFWRDAIKQVYEDIPPQHPIALGLHHAVRVVGRVPAYHLKRIVDARDEDLSRTSYMTTDDLTSLTESTSSSLLYAQLALLSLTESDQLAHAASHVGVASGLATLLRAMPFHTSQRRMILPVDLTAQHGVSQEDVFRHGPDAKGVSDAVFALATVANDHLLTARDMFKDPSSGGIPERAMPVLAAAAVPARLYLEKLEAANFNAFAPQLQGRDWKLAWRMWRSLRTRTI
ncbi:hypothetical protein EXIGLDRAFT_743267 [Exidia glandulosa HHB12029]|uniref:Terpenoid synthase n=1 Tax=Exidia glandulosa HHB12029 TaxID=1314781 RepID=A0A166NA40_EXIGL|nr:hypothetical protein EXIGLDRAFT_743267 [Exidia glandulosa HHB12029]